MRLLPRLSGLAISTASLSLPVIAFVIVIGISGVARADQQRCRCLAIAADVPAALIGEVARADGLFARGDAGGAYALYARLYASVKEPTLLYAQAMAKWQLGATAEARALFQAYLAAGGALAYRVQAEAGLRDLGGVVGGVASGVGGVAGGVVGGVGGLAGGAVRGVGGVTGDVGGAAVGGVGAGVGAGLGVAGKVTAKPKKVAGGAAVVLGVVAVAALGVVAIHSIAAGFKDDVELDAKFDLGFGLTGVAVGATAFYVGSLTVATGAAAGAAGAVPCVSLSTKQPLVAPIALPGGGGLATAIRF